MRLEEFVRGGDLDAAGAALRGGADVNHRDRMGTPVLMVAAGLGLTPMVATLLEAGADPNAVDRSMGAAPLHRAAQAGNPDVIRLLLDHGAFVDQQSPTLGNTPLLDAILHKQEAAVRALLERGARTTIRNHWQQSALELAREDGFGAIVAAFEARDADDRREAECMALGVAVKAGDAAAVDQLIASGVDLDARLPVVGRVDDAYTPLGLAVRSRRADMVVSLLDAGADPAIEIGLMRGTVLHEASFLGVTDILEILLERRRHGSDVRLDLQGPYNGLTPLHDAVWHGHLDAAQALVAAGAPLDLRTHAGLTPRDMALLYGYGDIARMLAEAERNREVD